MKENKWNPQLKLPTIKLPSRKEASAGIDQPTADDEDKKRRRRQLLGSAGIVALCFFVGFLLFLYKPLSARWNAHAVGPATSQPSIETIQASSQTEQAAQTALPLTPPASSELEATIGKSAALDSVRIIGWVAQSSPSEVKPEPTYQVTAVGSFAAILNFVDGLTSNTQFDTSHQLTTHGELFVVPSMSLKPQDSSGSVYQASFTLVAPVLSASSG